MSNHNKLLALMDGCIGLKTGYTRAAGRTLVSCAERNGQRLVAVTLQDGNDWADHQSLLEYGFANWPAKRAATLGKLVERVPVTGGMKETAALIAADSFSWPLGEGETLETSVELYGGLTAPVRAGTKAGEAVFRLNGQEVGRIELLCGETVLPAVASAMSVLKTMQK